MTLNIISEWADAQETQKVLDSNADLAKLAYEFCARFNARVSGHSMNTTQLSVHTLSGLTAGKIFVDKGYVNHETKIIYKYSSPLVNKAKGSAQSDSSTRDSTKLTGLLKAIEKNNEHPHDKGLYKSFRDGLSYAFGATDKTNTHRVHADYDLVVNVMLRYAGEVCDPLDVEDKENMLAFIQEHKQRTAENNEHRELFTRFAKGATAIYVRERGTTPAYYLVGKARLPVDAKYAGRVDRNDITIENLKRYNTLSEIPELAGHALILREYFKSKYQGGGNNELGVIRRDDYYPEVDVATGYVGSGGLWVLIPDEAPND